MRGIFSWTAILVFSFSSINQAYAEAVQGGIYSKSKANPDFIRITRNDDQTVTFEYCEDRTGQHCKRLGGKQSYSTFELQKKHNLLRTEARRVLFADMTYLVAAGIAGTIATLAMSNPVGLGTIAIYAASGAAGGGTFLLRSYIAPGMNNPVEKYKAARALDKRYFLGQCVTINGAVFDYASILDTVLKEVG